jgi:ankyrin repeat protein
MSRVPKLHSAIRQSNISQVNDLLAQGADVNARSPQQRTPLHVAAEEGNAVLTGILIAAGADINAKMKYGETPLDRAVNCGQGIELCDLDFKGDVLDRRLQKRLFDTMIKTVVEPDSATKLVSVLNNPDYQSTIDTILQQHNLDAQIIDEIQSAFCTTPRNESGYLATAKILLLAGANPNPNDDDELPLKIAIQAGSIAMVELLLEYGANIDIESDRLSRYSPLFTAIESRRFDLVKLLLDRGANPNGKDNLLNYLIYYYNQIQYRSLITLFLEAGADVNLQDEFGDTPLLSSLLLGHESLALQLLDAGGDIDIANKLGLTAFHGAFTHQMEQFLKILGDRDMNLDPNSLALNWVPESDEHLNARNILLSKRQQEKNSRDKYCRQFIDQEETLIAFFSLDASSQITILPKLDREVMFNCAMGEVFTDVTLYGLASQYEDDFHREINSFMSDENENFYDLIDYAMSSIRQYVELASNNDDFWEPAALLTPQWTLIRLLSQFIKQYLNIEKKITKKDLDKCYVPMVDN